MSNSVQTFNHTTLNTIEYGMTNAFIAEFWSYLTEEIKKSDLFDDMDKDALFKNNTFMTQFLDDNESYIHQKVIKP
jgi:hypothetical protein